MPFPSAVVDARIGGFVLPFVMGFLVTRYFGGTVYQTSLSNEDEDNLKKALEHEQVSASADEMLELE